MAKRKHVPVKKVARRKKDARVSAPVQPAVGGAPVVPQVQGAPREIRSAAPASSGVPGGICDQLNRTKGWVVFASVIFFLAAFGYLVLAVLGILGMVAKGAAEGDSGEGGEMLLSSGALAGWGFVLVTTIFLGLFSTLGLRLVRFSNRVTTLNQSRKEEDLEFVLGYLRQFWQLLAGSILTMLISMLLLGLLSR